MDTLKRFKTIIAIILVMLSIILLYSFKPTFAEIIEYTDGGKRNTNNKIYGIRWL